MGYGIKFLSRTKLKNIIETTKDPMVKVKAESTLVAYEAHLALQSLLEDALAEKQN